MYCLWLINIQRLHYSSRIIVTTFNPAFSKRVTHTPMRAKKIHYCILLVSLILCILVVCDAFFSPSKFSVEIVKDGTAPVSGTSTYVYQNFYLTTDRRKYQVDQSFYNYANIGDTIIIHRSAVTNVIKKMSVVRQGMFYTYTESFITRNLGMFIFPAILGIAGFIIFYERLKNMQGRKNITFFLLIITLALLFGYTNLSFFNFAVCWRQLQQQWCKAFTTYCFLSSFYLACVARQLICQPHNQALLQAGNRLPNVLLYLS